jgi:NAD(P)-dependent dehydrogenase (short-subunit alcohol dehydrogenase family)
MCSLEALTSAKSLISFSFSSGIGRAVAVLFAREGSDVTIVYLPAEQEDAEDTKKMVEKEGQKCLLVPGDLMDNKFCEQAVQKHVKEFGKIHTLVNNASKQIMCNDIAKINLDDVESSFKSNIIQMFAITKFALPHMEKGGSSVQPPKQSLKTR